MRIFLLSTIASLALGAASTALAQAPTTLIDCPEGEPGDNASRGFYIDPYPGKTLHEVTLFLSSDEVLSPNVTLTAHAGAYDGSEIASDTVSTSLDNDSVAVTFTFDNAPVTQGSTVAFTLSSSGTLDDIRYDVPPEFDDFIDSEDPCPYVVQTNGTSAPLDSFRRDAIRIEVVGKRQLEVSPSGSIQLAIDAAEDGDTVSVGPGAYTERINLRSNVRVIGAGPEDTILQSEGGCPVTAQEVTDTELSGFTIQPASGFIVEQGVCVFGGSPLIKNNIVQGFSHRGVSITSGSTALVCGNRVRNNGSDANELLDYGIINLRSNTLISNNLITGNETGCYIGWEESDNAQFINNTLADNTSEGVWAYQSDLVIKNNLVIQNGTGVHASFENAQPELTYNNVFNNGSNYSSSNTGVTNVGAGSLSVDPMLDPDAAGDYIPLEESPLVDAGDPDDIYNDNDGTRNDIGWTGGPCAVVSTTPAPFEGFIFTTVGNIPVNFIGDSDGLANVPQADADALRIPAWNNTAFGGNPRIYGVFGDGVDPNLYVIEAREQGATDAQEIIAGADPMDPKDRLRLLIDKSPGDTVTLQAKTHPGRLYDILWSPSLTNFQPIEQGLTASTVENQVTIERANPKGFYRLQVTNPTGLR